MYTKGEIPRLLPKPDDIPSAPSFTYVDGGWKGEGDWFGTGRVADRDKQFLPFKQARIRVGL
jgi:hypothetical protein